MVRYVLTKVLRGVKALQTRKKSGNGLKTYYYEDLQAILQILKVNFVVVVVT